MIYSFLCHRVCLVTKWMKHRTKNHRGERNKENQPFIIDSWQNIYKRLGKIILILFYTKHPPTYICAGSLCNLMILSEFNNGSPRTHCRLFRLKPLSFGFANIFNISRITNATFFYHFWTLYVKIPTFSLPFYQKIRKESGFASMQFKISTWLLEEISQISQYIDILIN